MFYDALTTAGLLEKNHSFGFNTVFTVKGANCVEGSL